MSPLRHGSDAFCFLCLLMAAVTAWGPAAAIAQQPSPRRPARQAPKAEPSEIGGATQDKTLLAGAAAPPSLDPAQVLPEACAIVAIRPAQLSRSPVLEMFPTEVLQAAMVQELGLDPLAAEAVVVSATPPMQGPPHYALVAAFNEPYRMKSSELTKHTSEATQHGKNYLKSNDPMAPSYYPLNANTLLAAPEHTLQQFVVPEARPAAAPDGLAAQLVAASRGDDLLAIVDVAALRPLIAMGLSQAKLPPDAAPLLQVPQLVRRAELRVNLSHPGVTELIVTANDETDAAKLIQLFNDAKQRLLAQVTAETSRGLTSDDPVEQATARYSQRISKLWDERLQLVQEGDRLVLFRVAGGVETQPLVATATIGVLVALLLPAVQAAREAARRNMSMNNMKQIMLGLLNHESAKGHFPAQANYDANGKPLLSWRVHILPYMEEQALYKQFRLDEPWDSEHNKQLIPLMPAIYLDPSSRLTPDQGKTHYLGVAGEGRLFRDQGVKIREIRDGTSKTIAVVQCGDADAVVWTNPDDWNPGEDDLESPFDPLRPGGFLAAFGDGHVQFISEDVDPEALGEMLSIAGDQDASGP